MPAGPPRFASHDDEGHTVGLMLRDEAQRHAPARSSRAAAISTPTLLERLAAADALLFDGTFWSDDELIALGIGTRTAREMDHLPIAGPGGSLERLADAAVPASRLHAHQQHEPDSAGALARARRSSTRAGLTVGFDGCGCSSEASSRRQPSDPLKRTLPMTTCTPRRCPRLRRRRFPALRRAARAGRPRRRRCARSAARTTRTIRSTR